MQKEGYPLSEEMDQFLDQKDEEPQEVRPLGSELY